MDDIDALDIKSPLGLHLQVAARQNRVTVRARARKQ